MNETTFKLFASDPKLIEKEFSEIPLNFPSQANYTDPILFRHPTIMPNEELGLSMFGSDVMDFCAYKVWVNRYI